MHTILIKKTGAQTRNSFSGTDVASIVPNHSSDILPINIKGEQGSIAQFGLFGLDFRLEVQRNPRFFGNFRHLRMDSIKSSQNHNMSADVYRSLLPSSGVFR
jgi:hypothetical protein